jgi:uncharacterized membrane protein YqgA involved in biofilm formation
MIEVICLIIAGVVIGWAIQIERDNRQYHKTFEEVDKQVRQDLEYYRNLSESLKQDLYWAKLDLAEERKKHTVDK